MSLSLVCMTLWVVFVKASSSNATFFKPENTI